MGTDEDTLIKILCHRTNSQRVKIAETYKALYGKVRSLTKINKNSPTSKFMNFRICEQNLKASLVETSKK